MKIEKIEREINFQEKKFFRYRDEAYKEFTKLQDLIGQHNQAVENMKARDSAIFSYGQAQPQQQLTEQPPAQAPPLAQPPQQEQKKKGRPKKELPIEQDLGTIGE